MMKKFLWTFKRRGFLFFGYDNTKKGLSSLKASFYAIIFGLLISILFILFNSADPIETFSEIIKQAFNYGDGSENIESSFDNTVRYTSIFCLAGLAMVISFKTGLFNIGVSGQMLTSGTVALFIARKMGNDFNKTGAILSLLIIGILLGATVAAFSGLLKSFFNVHEVVSTIMMNWIIWFSVKSWFLASKKSATPLVDANNLVITPHDFFSTTSNVWIIGFIIALLSVFLVWFLLKKTVFGYKITAVGLNSNASKYGGVNVKLYTIYAMAFSGALAGVAGVLYHTSSIGSSLDFLTDIPPTIGFDGIAVALIGASSAFGVLAAAFLWGIIKQGASVGAQIVGLRKEVADLIFGILIYSASVAAIFQRIEIIRFVSSKLQLYRKKESKQQYNDKKLEIKQVKTEIKTFKKDYQEKYNQLNTEYKKHFMLFKTEINNNISALKQQNPNDYKTSQDYQDLLTLLESGDDQTKEIKQQMNRLAENAKSFFEEKKVILKNLTTSKKAIVKKNYKTYLTTGFKGAKRQYHYLQKVIMYDCLDKVTIISTEKEFANQASKKTYKEQLKVLKDNFESDHQRHKLEKDKLQTDYKNNLQVNFKVFNDKLDELLNFESQELTKNKQTYLSETVLLKQQKLSLKEKGDK